MKNCGFCAFRTDNLVYFYAINVKDQSLKRLVYILSFMLIAVISSNSQSNRSISNGPGERIVKTYPVPAISYITIEPVKATNTNYVLVIYNFLGRKMYEKQNFSQKTTIMLDEFTRGVYIYHLTDLTGRLVESGKFQVSK
jgi:hypothetical protein